LLDLNLTFHRSEDFFVKYFILYILFAFSLLTACSRKVPAVVTFTLKHSDFLEIIDAQGTIQAVNNNALTTPRVYSGLQVSYLAKDGAYVKKGDTICILAAPDLMVEFENFKTGLEKMQGRKDSLEATQAMQLSILEAQVKTNEAQMEISMLDSIQMKFAPPVKQKLLNLEMEKVKLEKLKLEKKLKAQRIIASSELSQIGSQIMMQKNRIQMYQSQINSLYLLAPTEGIVMHAEAPTFYTSGGSTIGGKIEVGSKVFQSMPLLQIPDISKMQVSVEVPEADYKRINTDQKVHIKLESEKTFETTGKIIRKSLATKNNDSKSSVKIYEVIISVDSCDSRLKPGLGASCRIIVNEIKDTVVVPAAAIFLRDSTKIIYVAKGDKFIPVTVETGISNSSESIVNKGIKGDETIALLEPPYKLIEKETKSKSPAHVKPPSGSNDTLKKASIIIKDTLTSKGSQK
jgi:multidrug efflux pump subunit AcrA (membrane-fusion protein)